VWPTCTHKAQEATRVIVLPCDIDFADVPQALSFTPPNLEVISRVYPTVGQLYIAFLSTKLPQEYDPNLRYAIGRRFEVLGWELPRKTKSWVPARGVAVNCEKLELADGISNKVSVSRLRLPQPVLDFLLAFGVRLIKDLRTAVRMNLLRFGVMASGWCVYTEVNRRLAAAGQQTL
jgi:hypothetical protein